MLCSGPVTDLVCGKAIQITKSINHGGKNGGAGRCHQLGVRVLLINGRMPEQIRSCRRGNRKYTVLAMNEATADVDRGAQEPLNAKCFETDRRTDGVDNRIDRADFVKLDIFRSDVVNLAFRYRQLRKYVRRDLLRFRVQLAFANHCQNLGRLAMKVARVMVTMIVHVSMLVFMLMFVLMVVIVAVRFAMRLMGGVVFVFLLTINQYIKFDGTDVRASNARHPQFVTVDRQLSQFGLEKIKTKAGVQERTDRHVAADAGKAIEVERLHTFLMLTLPFMLLDLHTRLKDALRSTIRTQWNIDPPDIVLNQTPKIEFGELATPVALSLPGN